MKNSFLHVLARNYLKRHRPLHLSLLFHSYFSLLCSQFWMSLLMLNRTWCWSATQVTTASDLPSFIPLFFVTSPSSFSSIAAILTPTTSCLQSCHQRIRLSRKTGERHVHWGRWCIKSAYTSFSNFQEFVCIILYYNMYSFHSCRKSSRAVTYFWFPSFANVLNKYHITNYPTDHLHASGSE